LLSDEILLAVREWEREGMGITNGNVKGMGITNGNGIEKDIPAHL